jgi:hypothetical protein
MAPIDLRINPSRLLILFVVGVVLLVAVGIAANFVLQAVPGTALAGLMRPLLLDEEASVPTYVASVLHLTAALLLIVYALGRRASGEPHAFRWLALGLVFVFLSMDEVVQVHERWDTLVSAIVGREGFAGSWVAIGLLLIGVTAVIWLPLYRSLPRRVAVLWLVAGAVFVAGAVGVEVFSKPFEPPETARIAYIFAVGLEEGLEMLGVVVFLYAQLLLIQGAASPAAPLQLRFGRGPEGSTANRPTA